MNPRHACLTLALASCSEPTLTSGTGGSSGSSGSSGDASSSASPTTGASSTTGTSTDPPACGGENATIVKWVRAEADEFPGFIHAVATNAAEEAIVVGEVETDFDFHEEGDDAHVRVYDADGVLRWSDTYAGTYGLGDEALDVAVDGGGHIHVLVREQVLSVHAGEQDFPSSDARLVILRYGPDGEHLWRWERERPGAVPPDSYQPEGSLGLRDGTIRLVEDAYGDPPRLITLDSAGNLLADVELDVPEQHFVHYRAVGGDGSALLAGPQTDAQGPGVWIGVFDDHGALAWSDRFPTTDEDDTVRTAMATQDGAVYLVHTDTALDIVDFHLRGYVAGELEWTTQLPLGMGVFYTGVFSRGLGIHCDASPLLAGSIAADTGPDNVPWVARYSLDGAPAWSLKLDPPAMYASTAYSVAGTPRGDVIIAGDSWIARLTAVASP